MWLLIKRHTCRSWCSDIQTLLYVLSIANISLVHDVRLRQSMVATKHHDFFLNQMEWSRFESLRTQTQNGSSVISVSWVRTHCTNMMANGNLLKLHQMRCQTSYLNRRFIYKIKLFQKQIFTAGSLSSYMFLLLLVLILAYCLRLFVRRIEMEIGCAGIDSPNRSHCLCNAQNKYHLSL